MIFIAENYNSEIIGIVSAKTKEAALAYWQGQELPVFRTKEFDINAEYQQYEYEV